MHVSEGVLPLWEVALGWGLTALGTAVGLKKLEGEKLPLAALLTALFFVASLVHVPVGVGSAHLLFNGLLGLLLGWGAFPALLVGLFLQAVLFQFGGLLVLGVNAFNMALPAVLAGRLFRNWIKEEGLKFYAGAFLTAFTAVLGSGLLLALELALAGEEFLTDALLVLALHLPTAAAEGLVYAFLLKFLKKNFPDLLEENR
ncbi:MAG: cobalt transporter CbiM [Aquificae bacterium]|nr:cobalt transporter CbiM [Aquificota bacterium]